MYEDVVLTERVCQKWNAKLSSEIFDVNDERRSGCSTNIDASDVKAIINVNPSQSASHQLTEANLT